MLTALELFGFKSFADRTRFDFAAGITCVVGPNGSGKSNVVDSIKWILGDQSPKSLRGKEMTDVIFNGAAHRKPAGFAEATLAFDNTRGALAFDAPEVRVGRRVYRSGEAEYLINGVPSRLKDVKDLFLGTGVGASAYSIIEQGRVDQLLQASNTARRNVFEEAAGISRFKLKKQEAERRLERVSQNLLRLTDIVSELESRLTNLRTQASRAAKFRDLSQQVRELRLGLACDDYRGYQSRLAIVAEQQAPKRARLAEQKSAAADAEQHQRQADAAVTEVEDRLRAVEKRDAELRSIIAGHEATVRHQSQRHDELNNEWVRLEQQQTELQARSHKLAEELAASMGELEQFMAQIDSRQDALRAAEQRLALTAFEHASDRQRMDGLRQRHLELIQRASSIANRCSAIASHLQAAMDGRQKSVLRLTKLALEVDAAASAYAVAQHAVAAAQEIAAEARAAADGRIAERNRLQTMQVELQSRLADDKERRGSLMARKQLLEDLERRQEGVGVGVRDVLTRARENPVPPWSSVLGCAADLLEVDIEHAALIELALGGRSQLIVIDDAGPIREFLNEGAYTIAGRVGFLTLVSGSPLSTQLPGASLVQSRDLTGLPGVICRADRLVRCSRETPNLAAQLLSDTWIAESLDAAYALADRSGPGSRFVTLQGELLDPDRSLHVGSLRSETTVVSRKSELRSVKTDLQKLDRTIAETEAALSTSIADHTALARELRLYEQRLADALETVAEARSQASAAELEMARRQQDHNELADEIVRADVDISSQQSLFSDAEVEQYNVQQQVQEMESEIAILEFQIANRCAADEGLQDTVIVLRSEVEALLEQLQAKKSTCTRLDEERFQRDLHRDEAESRFNVIDAKRRTIAAQMQETNELLAELHSQRAIVAAEAAAVQSERNAARELRSKLADEELKQRHAARALADELHEFDLAERELRHQLETLCERLRDEDQVELVELAAADLSARRDYLQKLAAEGVGDSEQGESSHETASTASSTALRLLGNDPVRERLEAELQKLRRKLKSLGNVSTESVQELDDLESRYTRLSTQLQDLTFAKHDLEEIIRRLSVESRRMFSETFNAIRGHFQELFRKLFGGGEGDVILEDQEDILECGIDVVARPPGKELRSISLLSGGEKTMTAVALLLAIFRTRPSPFCILDEVDAALDEGNVERYLGVLREFQQWTQFIVITHNKRTMSGADVLYGVTMEEAGVSKRMSVRFEDVGENGEIKSKPGAGSVSAA